MNDDTISKDHCHSCNAEDVYHLWSDGEYNITLKLETNQIGMPFVGILVRDGNYNFQEGWMDAREYDGFILKLLSIRKPVKKMIKEFLKDV